MGGDAHIEDARPRRAASASVRTMSLALALALALAAAPAHVAPPQVAPRLARALLNTHTCTPHARFPMRVVLSAEPSDDAPRGQLSQDTQEVQARPSFPAGPFVNFALIFQLLISQGVILIIAGLLSLGDTFKV